MQIESIKRRRLSANEILATRMQTFIFSLNAERPENALNRLRTRNRTDDSLAIPQNARLWMSTWVDPSEEGSAWLFRNNEFFHDPTGQTVLAWDGKNILRQRVPVGFTASMFFGE